MKIAKVIEKQLGFYFQIAAWASLALGVVFFVILLVGVFTGSRGGGFGTSLLALVLGVFYFMFFFMVSEVLRLLKKIERNTSKDGSEI